MYDSIRVSDVLRKKGQGYLGIGPKAMAYDALELMAQKNVGALMVVDEGRLVGVFSERDYARKVILKGKSSKSTTVEDLMSSPPICARPQMTMNECMVLMTAHHVRHLPVLDGGTVAGVVSIGDVVATIIKDQEATIHQLENYISGEEYVLNATVR
ncbi:MAG: CBS domain-containing protein [Nitrospirota bacterium]|nr:CBS domain-containing protein [Nitrospirota bacterium]